MATSILNYKNEILEHNFVMLNGSPIFYLVESWVNRLELLKTQTFLLEQKLNIRTLTNKDIQLVTIELVNLRYELEDLKEFLVKQI